MRDEEQKFRVGPVPKEARILKVQCRERQDKGKEPVH